MLNPNLYNALKRLVAARMLPGKEVRIRNDNQTLKGRVIVDPITLRKKMKADDGGESYWVCCPACRDTRYRLCINHRWNVWDDVTKSSNLGLLHCFNEECQSHIPGFAEEMLQKVRQYIPKGLSVLPPKNVAPSVADDKVINPPGLCANVSDLPPTHPAVRFLLARGYDYKLLGKHFNVEFCYTSNYPLAQNRIIFPVYMNGELVGWQARYIDSKGGGDVKGLYFCRSCRQQSRYESKPKACSRCHSDSVEPVPKYWTCPGFKKGMALMNYDHARSWTKPSQFVIIVEGPMDVLQIGSPEGSCLPGPAVALYGHSLSAHQKVLLWNAWRGKTIILMLDADAYKDAENICLELKTSGMFKAVIPILLPDNRDPAECDHAFIWKLLQDRCSAVNIDLFA